jgi:hypothetical protein
MYNSDIDTVTYIHIYMHTDARPSMPSHRYTHACIYIHTRMHEEMAAAKRTWNRRCACACAHLGIRTRLDARASIQTHSCTDGHTTPARAHTHTHTFTQTWIRCMHSYLYICAHTYTYICKSCGRARPRRSRRALTRTYAHAHTRRQVLYICSLTYTYGLEHTLIYMYIVTHN